MRRDRALVIAIVLLLAAVVVSPSLHAGWQDLQSARQADSEGRHADASALYERAARLLPWRADLWEPAGLAAFQAGNGGDAIRLLDVASKRAPLSLEGSVALGSALWNAGQTASAIAAWQNGLQAHPSQPALLDRLIAAYDHEGDYVDEQAALVRRLSVGEDAAASYRLGLLLMLNDPGSASARLQAAASLNPGFESAANTLQVTVQAASEQTDGAKRFIVIGRGLGLVGEWPLAVQSFEQAVAASPEDAEAWAWLGEAQQHDNQDGAAAVKRALSLGSDDPLVHSLLSLYWNRRGDYAAALKEQLLAAQLDPQNASMQSALGDAYAAAGDLVAALAAYQQATLIAPSDPAAWRQLASFCADNGVQVKEVGLPAAQKAAALAPHDPQTLDVLGWSLTQAGSPSTGKETLLRAIQADPGFPLAHLHLAETYLQMGDYASAPSELRQAVELDPEGAVGQLAAQLLKQYFP